MSLHSSKNFARFEAPAAVAIRVALAALLSSLPLAAQQTGPLPPAPPRAEYPAAQPPMDAPSRIATPSSEAPISSEPPAIPVDQIIRQFAQREAEFRSERENFTYTQTYIVQTIDSSGRPDGEYRMTSDITFTPSGKRYENVTFAPPPTLQRIYLSQQDFDDIRDIQPFVLTTEDLPKYNVTYVGRQRVDEISAYVFDVGPKIIEKNRRYFQGRIWVDDQDFEIVKTFGKAVPDIRKKNNENVFPRFETYRENIEGHYWFPTYTHADDFLKFSTGDIHIRMIVRYEDYKRFRASVRILAPIGPAPTTPDHP